MDRSGRPSGGLCILWKTYLNNGICPIPIPNSKRIQAVEVYKKIIIFNCYFPWDTQDKNFDVWELLKCIEEINFVV